MVAMNAGAHSAWLIGIPLVAGEPGRVTRLEKSSGGPLMRLRSNRIIPCRISQSVTLIMIAECIQLPGVKREARKEGEKGDRGRRAGSEREREGEREHMLREGMIIIELSERRLMTLVTLPMAGSQEGTNAIAISRIMREQPVQRDDAFYISGFAETF